MRWLSQADKTKAKLANNAKTLNFHEKLNISDTP
jgi:hypothetical protein